jgi:hypothetical protein
VDREISEAQCMLCTNNASEKKTGINYSPSQSMSPSHQTVVCRSLKVRLLSYCGSGSPHLSVLWFLSDPNVAL